MFGFFKKQRAIQEAQLKIGKELHRQIKNALRTDDALATQRLSSAFTVGYITGFTRSGFMLFDIEPDKIINDEIRYICDGIINKVLYEIFLTQAALVKLSSEMENPKDKVLDTGLSPENVLDDFRLGMESGRFDASLISLKSVQADNFCHYLLKEPLNLQ
ncbi:MAG: hypothetical protein WA123_12405 [Methylotenera sp.]